MWGPKHRIYRTADDGMVFVAVIEQKFWDRLCHALGRDDLLASWSSDGQVDYGGGDELEAELESIFGARTAADWGAFFVEHDLPGTPLLDLGEVMGSEHFAVRGMLEPVADRPVPNLASPIRWIDRPGDRPGRDAARAPDVGADTDAVLRSWLGDGG
jgi:crotonobetainyl-CoA:carnitine CoA-transferase CaiB-like acyl-CoA transferase